MGIKFRDSSFKYLQCGVKSDSPKVSSPKVFMLSLTLTCLLIFQYPDFSMGNVNVATPVVESVKTKDEPRESKYVEEMILGLAAAWLKQGIMNQEIAPIKNGLGCFDALGGPSPLEIITYVINRIEDQDLAAQLHGFSESHKNDFSPSPGPSACIQWILEL